MVCKRGWLPVRPGPLGRPLWEEGCVFLQENSSVGEFDFSPIVPPVRVEAALSTLISQCQVWFTCSDFMVV